MSLDLGVGRAADGRPVGARRARMFKVRGSGILLHPSSLPGPYGVGDFGPAAVDWLDFLAGAEQTVWQMLPLNPVGAAGCPYQAPAVLAISPLFISPHRLRDDGLLGAAELAALPVLPQDRVDYSAAAGVKQQALRRAYAAFSPTDDSVRYCRQQAWWLDDYARYSILQRRFGKCWQHWPPAFASRDSAALASLDDTDAAELGYYRFEQYIVDRHLAAVRREAAERYIELLGDVAMFPGTDSADTWAAPEWFAPVHSSPAPAEPSELRDRLTADGHDCGTSPYRWDRLEESDYSWWISRLRRMIARVDGVRLYRSPGAQGDGAVPPDARGREAPGELFFKAVGRDLGGIAFLADDLGSASEAVQRRRQDADVTDVRVLQFAFGGDESRHLPHHYPRECVAYTGSLGNGSTTGWWAGLSSDERNRVLHYLGGGEDGICWAMARAVLASVACLSILPMQDVLELDSRPRMSVPGQPDESWTWRLPPQALSAGLAGKVRRLTELYGRDRLAGTRRTW